MEDRWRALCVCQLVEADTKWIIHGEATAVVTVPGRSGFEVGDHLYLPVSCSILYIQCVCVCAALMYAVGLFQAHTPSLTHTHTPHCY